MRIDELDSMATAAGLSLRHRWAGWRRQLFRPGQSGWQVAVYQLADGA